MKTFSVPVENLYQGIKAGGIRVVTLEDHQETCRTLVDIAEHIRYCRECGETDVLNCPEGKELWIQYFTIDRGADGT